MTTTVSKVIRTDEVVNEFMREWCDKVAANGGTFAISNTYETGYCWFTTYTIDWPEGMKVEIPE